MTMICSHRNPEHCRPVDSGHCGTVRNMRDAGALRDECGFAECVCVAALGWEAACNCPHRWVKCKDARSGYGEEAGSKCVPWVHKLLHVHLFCSAETSSKLVKSRCWVKQKKKMSPWNIKTSASTGKKFRRGQAGKCVHVSENNPKL